MAMSEIARAHRLSPRTFAYFAPSKSTAVANETTGEALARSNAVRQARAERIAQAKAARPQPKGALMGSRYQGGWVGSPLSAR